MFKADNRRITSVFITVFLFFVILNFKTSVSAAEERIFLIGIDALNWRVIDSMIQKGELPNIKKLKETGSYGYLATDIGESPVSWTTIVTGKGMDKHGIDSDLSNKEKFSKDTKSRCKKIWDILESRGKKVGVHKWVYFPRNREINGFWVPTDSVQSYAWPVELRKELMKLDSQDELRFLIEKYNCDFIATFADTVDSVQHHYWLYFYLEENEDLSSLPAEIVSEIHKYAEKIYGAYREIDSNLGDLMGILNKNDSIIIVSDHGARLACLAKNLRINKRLLREIDVYTGWIDDEETLDRGQWQNIGFDVAVDYSDSFLSPVFSNETLKDYEEQITSPVVKIFFDETNMKRELELVKESMIGILGDITHEDIRIFDLESKSEYQLTFCLSEAIKFYLSKIRDPIETEYFDLFTLTGGHGIGDSGVIILNGNKFKENYRFGGAYLYDIVPTILYLMNLPVGQDMDGRVLRSTFKNTKFKRPKLITTYEDNTIYTNTNADVKKVLSAEEKRKLRSLGYIQ